MSSTRDGVVEINDDDVCMGYTADSLLSEERKRLSALEAEHKRVLAENVQACRFFEKARRSAAEGVDYKGMYEALQKERKTLVARNERMEGLLQMCEGVDLMSSAITCAEDACKEEHPELTLRAIECLRGVHGGFSKSFRHVLRTEMDEWRACKRPLKR